MLAAQVRASIAHQVCHFMRHSEVDHVVKMLALDQLAVEAKAVLPSRAAKLAPSPTSYPATQIETDSGFNLHTIELLSKSQHLLGALAHGFVAGNIITHMAAFLLLPGDYSRSCRLVNRYFYAVVR